MGESDHASFTVQIAKATRDPRVRHIELPKPRTPLQGERLRGFFTYPSVSYSMESDTADLSFFCLGVLRLPRTGEMSPVAGGGDGGDK